MIVKHEKTKKVLGSKVKYASSFGERLIGLMFIKDMIGFDGLVIDPCNSIHNCFVKFPIDAIFLDKHNCIVKILRNFRPWRFSGIYFKASKVIEFKAGTVEQTVNVGDYLEVSGV